MVVYTAEARTGAGGAEAIHSLIQLAVAEANTVYQNSQVNVRLSLVYRGEIEYTEFANNSTNLNRLQARTDGFMDEVHSIREANGADLVCLVTEHSDPGNSGLAFTMSQPGLSFRDRAFSVVKRADLVGAFIFVHEVSHNFGAQHDRENSLDEEGKLSPGSFPFSFGHRFTVNGVTYRDVMSYAPGQLIPYLSNPDVLFQGVPTGLPGTTNGANNALTINSNAVYVAAFYGKAVQSVPPEIVVTAPTNGLALTAGSDLVFVAQASDQDGSIRKVEFYHENELVGVATNISLGLGTNSYSVVWSNLPPGRHTLAAQAVDDAGASSTALYTELIARPVNDSFTNRIAILGPSPSVSGSNREATLEDGEPMHGGNPGGSSVWYSWLAPRSGTVTLTATGVGIVPLAEVYKSLTSTSSTSVSLSFRLDTTNGVAQTTFDAIGGESYSIAIDALAGRSGEFSIDLRYEPPPSNDDFANRSRIAGESLSFNATNFASTSEPGERLHAQNPGGKSVWYSWTATKTGPVVVTVTATNFFPLADVYAGLSIATLATEPSRSFVLDTTNRVLTLAFEAAAGREYALAVDGFAGAAGTFLFTLGYPPPPPNDNFANRTPLLGPSISVQTSNLFAGKEDGEPEKHAGVVSSRTIWYAWSAPVSGPVTLNIRGEGFITWGAAYTGNSITNLKTAPSLAVKYDTNTLTTRLSFVASALTTYAIVLDGFNNRSGPISFSLATSNSPPSILSLSAPIMLGAGFNLAIAGSAGQRFTVQASTNLVDWAEILAGLFATNRTEVSDLNSPQFKYRFYRVLPIP
ncbi:MAG: hypothetical protein HY735_06870 [Verrucomicrobia bacterium]|nr:hypothetical protein [Verrucomicrobiota bacterium]